MELTDKQFEILAMLETNYRVRIDKSLDSDVYFELIRLKNAGYVKIVPPDPNFSYLPDYNASDQFFALDSEGAQALHLEQDRLKHEVEQEAKRKAEREADRANADKDRKLHFAHEWKIAVFSALTSFIAGALADHFFNVIACTVEWWTSFFSHP